MMRRRAAGVLFWVSDRLHRLSERIEDLAFSVRPAGAEPSWDNITADAFIPELWVRQGDQPSILDVLRRPEGDTIHIPRRSMRKDQKPCDQ